MSKYVPAALAVSEKKTRISLLLDRWTLAVIEFVVFKVLNSVLNGIPMEYEYFNGPKS